MNGPFAKLPGRQPVVKHAVYLGSGAALHFGHVEEGNGRGNGTQAGKDEARLGLEVALVRIENVGEHKSKEAGTEARREPTDALRLGSQVQRRGFGSNGVRRWPDAQPRDNDNHDQGHGSEPARVW